MTITAAELSVPVTVMVPPALAPSILEALAVILVVPPLLPTPRLAVTLPLLLPPLATLMVPHPPIPSALAPPRPLLTAMVLPPLIPSALVQPKPPLTATEPLPPTPSALDQVCCEEIFGRHKNNNIHNRENLNYHPLFFLVSLLFLNKNKIFKKLNK
jgi:hypothetical protein